MAIFMEAFDSVDSSGWDTTVDESLLNSQPPLEECPIFFTDEYGNKYLVLYPGKH